jgi:hypothetical protein
MKTKLRYQLGAQQHHTVYEGEGVGAVLGTRLVSREWGVRSAIFYIDNQASITATQLINPTSGHHIFNTFNKEIEALKKNTAEYDSKSSGYQDTKEWKEMNRWMPKQRRR